MPAWRGMVERFLPAGVAGAAGTATGFAAEIEAIRSRAADHLPGCVDRVVDEAMATIRGANVYSGQSG